MKRKHNRRSRGSAARTSAPGGAAPSSRPGRARPWIGIAAACGLLLAAGFILVRWLNQGPAPRTETALTAPDASSTARGIESTASTQASKSGRDEAVAEQVNQANELLTQGNPARAAEILRSVIETHPEDEDVHYNLGIALGRLGQSEEAIKHYEEALRLFPDYVEVHNNLGNLLMRMGRLQEATGHFEAAVKIMPDYAPGWNNLGSVQQRRGLTNEALAGFQKAVELDPDYWEAQHNLATSFWQHGRLADARAGFEAVLKLQPAFEPAKQALARIGSTESAGSPPKP